jgi:endoglucanase
MPRRFSLRALPLIGALMFLATITAPTASAAAAPATVAVVDGANGTLNGWYMEKVADPSAGGGVAVKYDWPGTVNLTVTLPADATSVTLRVRGDQCAGAPAYTLTIDGAAVASDSVASTSWANRTYSVPLVAGVHSIAVAYTNEHTEPWPNACDRNLYLDTVTFTGTGALANNPPVPAGFVHQSGTGLLNGAGQPVRLHGVDLGGWLLWEGWLWGGAYDYIGESAMMGNLASLVGSTQADQFQGNVLANYVTSNDFHAIAADGFNVARVPFNYRLLEDDSNPFVYKQSGWAVLDRLVSEAKQAGVYLILDMHAAPCSQMRAFVSDYVPGTNDLWGSTQCQDRMVAMWKAIAARYANQNIIAGYDLLGETVIGDAQLMGLYQRVTAAIRQVDPKHLIIYEGNNMARAFGMFARPLDSNEMLSFHDYAWAFPGQDISVRMAAWDAAAKRLNAPLYAGEFGESTYADDQNYVTTFNKDPLMAAWTEWTWKQAPGFAAMQNIQESPAAQALVDWIDNPSRPRPTPAAATQGMSDFINEIRYENTMPDAMLRGILTAPSVTPATRTAAKRSATASPGWCRRRMFSPHRCPSRTR